MYRKETGHGAKNPPPPVRTIKSAGDLSESRKFPCNGKAFFVTLRVPIIFFKRFEVRKCPG